VTADDLELCKIHSDNHEGKHQQTYAHIAESSTRCYVDKHERVHQLYFSDISSYNRVTGKFSDMKL